jgi:hypothetical protein
MPRPSKLCVAMTKQRRPRHTAPSTAEAPAMTVSAGRGLARAVAGRGGRRVGEALCLNLPDQFVRSGDPACIAFSQPQAASVSQIRWRKERHSTVCPTPEETSRQVIDRTVAAQTH